MTSRVGGVLGTVALAWLVGCGPERELREWTAADHGQPQEAAEPRPAEPRGRGGSDGRGGGGESPAEAERRAAAALWTVSCASCHGATGAGDGPERPASVTLADLRSPEWQQGRTDEELRVLIASGRGEMPAFGERLGAGGVTALVAHVRRLAAHP